MTIPDRRPLVLHVIYALGTGGLENGLVNIVNRSDPRRYRHAILCLTASSHFSTRIRADRSVEIIELGKRPGHDLKVYAKLVKELQRLKPDIVHTRNLAALEMQLLVAVFSRAVRIHGEHGRDIHDLQGTSRKYNLLRKLIRPFIHRYIAVSRDLASWLIQALHVKPSKVHQIYNGVDPQRFSPEGPLARDLAPPGFIDSHCVVIGTVGRLAEVKNQMLLLDAFEILVKTVPRVVGKLRLMLVGEGPLRKSLEKQIAERGLSDQVWLVGDQTEVPALLRMMDIFVLPSLAEGISNTVLEAMATGLPVVATKVGGNPELIEDGVNGFLVPSENRDAMATTLRKLIMDRELRQRVGDKALGKIREGFDWQKTTEKYLAVYDQALGISQQETKAADKIISGN